MSWTEVVPEALKSARGSAAKYAARKSKMSCTAIAPEQLKSAGRVVYVASLAVTLPRALATRARIWKCWGWVGLPGQGVIAMSVWLDVGAVARAVGGMFIAVVLSSLSVQAGTASQL